MRTAQLISTFIFAKWTVRSIFYLNPKFQASSHLLWLYSLVGNPGNRFSHNEAHFTLFIDLYFSDRTPTIDHSGKKIHSCLFCPKLFSKPSLVIRHERIHTGEKPYSCEICGRCFSTKDGLKSHSFTHLTR